ncbi:MAG: F-type H+-transporting ATPase subunit b [Thermoleophilaceae bacterium]|jgi:F-type H+-transporting ATPase subunit b|nr:F-type H+-transporting ATPase subunit b [Thermoleophilaceae bacterium]
MGALTHIASPVLGQSGGSGNFLVSPSVGLMIWTLITFGVTLYLLRRLAFPRIQDALDRRSRAISESIDAAERTRTEADQLLNEYRERLREAREQADEIVSRARKAADRTQDDARVQAKETREDMLADARRDIEQETRRAIGQIRREVADMTVMATEKLTRKTLDADDHKRLIDEALGEFDFSQLPGGESDGSQN